ncbi:hypothetical protein IR009_12425 [Pseudomonas putida]|uniref:hypothetical protein n=1 Tax=Pseudomonas putida TaxID=303 RepID=UPI0018AB081A|nr:hypothetical protein [Pseudomonas putida]MBF8766029.1 hypothetical protein [Pseudomonas putida]
MTLEQRMALSGKLMEVLQQELAQHLCTGTGKECRERKHELARLMARVSGAVMYDGLPASEQAFRTRRLEHTMAKAAEDMGQHVWQAGG